MRALTRIGLKTATQDQCAVAKYDLPPINFMRECFACDPAEGVVRWRARPLHHFAGNRSTQSAFNRRFAGTAGGVDNLGYIHFGVFWQGRTMRLKAHRIAFALYSGRIGFRKIDHVNQVRTDNRAANLREATSAQNMANRGKLKATGLPKGVSFVRARGRFQATAKKDGRTIHLGLFRAPKAAHEAFCRFAREEYGEFFNPGPRIDTIWD